MARNTKKMLGVPFIDYTATIIGSELDMTDSKWITELIIPIGTVTTADGSNYFEFKVQQSETSGGTYSDANSEQYDVMGDWDLRINAVGEADTVKSLNFRLKNGYPYLKVVATMVGTAQATFGSVVLKNSIRKPDTT